MSSGSKKRKPTATTAEFPRRSRKKNSDSFKAECRVVTNVARPPSMNLKKLRRAVYCNWQQEHEAKDDKKCQTGRAILSKLPSPTEIKRKDCSPSVNKNKLSFSFMPKPSLVKSINVLSEVPSHKQKKEESPLMSRNKTKLHGIVRETQKSNASFINVHSKRKPYTKILSSNISSSDDIMTLVHPPKPRNENKSERTSYLSVSNSNEKPQSTEITRKIYTSGLDLMRDKSEDHKKSTGSHFTKSIEKIDTNFRTGEKVFTLDNEQHKNKSSTASVRVYSKKNKNPKDNFGSVDIKTTYLQPKKGLSQSGLVAPFDRFHTGRVLDKEESGDILKKSTRRKAEIGKDCSKRAFNVAVSNETSKKHQQLQPASSNDRPSTNHPHSLPVEPVSCKFSIVELRKRYDRAHTTRVHNLPEATQSFPMPRTKNSSDTSVEYSTDIQRPVVTSKCSSPSRAVSLKVYSQSGYKAEAGNLRSLPVPSSGLIEDSDMEWEAIDNEKVLLDIKEHRQQCQETGNHYDEPMEVMETNFLDLTGNGIENNLIVLDTNILISHLTFVEALCEQEYKGMGCPLLVIPWMVLKELDVLKGGHDASKFKDSKLKYKARLAANFINKCFCSHHPRVKGQSAVDDKEHLIEVDVPDDSILNCCLQLQKKGQRVVLLSNDVNFCNKSMATGIMAFGKDHMSKILNLDSQQLADSLTKIFTPGTPMKESAHLGHPPHPSVHTDSAKRPSKLILPKFKSLLQDFLTKLIEAEMKNVYEEMWIKIVIIKPPWSAVDGLKCLSKHWVAVFGSIMKKSAQNVIQNMLNVFRTEKSSEGSTQDKLEKLVQEALNLCGTIHSESYQSLTSEYKNHFKSLLKTIRASKLGDNTKNLEDAPASKVVPEISDNLVEQSGSSSVLEVFQYIWNLVNEFCGVTCDILGIGHSISYQRPENFPSLEEVKRRLPEALHYVGLLVSCISSIMETPAECLSTKHPAITSLLSVIQTMVAAEFVVNKAISCEKLLVFCVDGCSRTLLMNGLQQFKEVQVLLSKVINYLEYPN